MSNWKHILRENLDEIGQYIKEKVVEEAKLQGHFTDVNVPGYSETFEDSIRWEILQTGSGFKLQVYGNDYILDMNKGISGRDVNYDPRDALDFARRVKPDLTQSEQLMYMINLREYQKKVGIPSPASEKFSENGRRTGFIEDSIVGNYSDISALVNTFLIAKSLAEEMVDGYKKVLQTVA